MQSLKLASLPPSNHGVFSAVSGNGGRGGARTDGHREHSPDRGDFPRGTADGARPDLLDAWVRDSTPYTAREDQRGLKRRGASRIHSSQDHAANTPADGTGDNLHPGVHGSAYDALAQRRTFRRAAVTRVRGVNDRGPKLTGQRPRSNRADGLPDEGEV